ncbi:MAG: VCBS repeat-containing protein, partial [Cytophagaceae bacterium]|nr:VCBS repeat-containing protein [Cytophagaceae bacterium]
AFVYKNNTMEEAPEKGRYLRVSFEGKGLNKAGLGARIEGVFVDGTRFYYENNPYRGYLSSVEPVAHIGLGAKQKIKELHVIWPNDSMQVIKNPGSNQVIKATISQAKQAYQPLFTQEKTMFADISEAVQLTDVHKEMDFIDFNFQSTTPHKMSQLGPGASVGDVNGDGREDLFIGGSKFYSGTFYLQQANGKFTKKYLEGAYDAPKKLGEDLGSLLIDMDRDGDLDLYAARGGTEEKLGSNSSQDVIYVNDGKGNFTLQMSALPSFTESNAAVRAADVDHDGDLDLFVSGRNVPFQYPKGTVSRLLRNDSKPGNVKFVDATAQLAPEFLQEAMLCDAVWTDYNQDGWQDLVVAGEFMPIQVFQNNKGHLKKLTDTGLEQAAGLWGSIIAADFDQDGDMDFVAGNMGKNTLLRANAKQPVEVLHGDLDGNGVYDVFPFVYFQNAEGTPISAPLFGKDDTHKQMNSTRARFVYYKDFGKVTQEGFLNEAEKKKANKLTLTENASMYIENKGQGKFDLHELPVMAQVSALNGMQVMDVNQDGYLDIVYVGNNYGNEVAMGRYDASNGGVLIGGPKGFKAVANSGVLVPGDAKSLVGIQIGNDLAYVALQNRGAMKVFKPLTPMQKASVPVGKDFTYVYKGRKQRIAWTYGASYLSQSNQSQAFIPAGAKLVQ